MTNNSKSAVLIALLLIALPASAAKQYSDLKRLMLDGLKNQVINAEVVGPVAILFQKQFDTKKPLKVRVTTIQTFRQPGCKRLNLEFTIKGAKMAEGIRDTARMNQQINLCPDGTPPTEGMDINNVGKIGSANRRYAPPPGMKYVK